MGRRIGTAVGVAVVTLLAIVLIGGTSPRRTTPAAAGEATSIASTSIASTSTSSSTSSNSTTSTSASSSTTSTIPGDTGAVGFVPACVPQEAASSAPITTPDDARLATFGAIGAAPTWTFSVPLLRMHAGEAPALTAARGTRIPGGFLIRVTAADPNSFAVLYGNSILMVVNDDGSVRWRQCRTDGFTGYMAVAHGGSVVPTQAVIAVSQAPQTSNEVDVDYRVIDLADGHDEGTVHDRAVAAGLDPAYLADQVHARGDHAMLFTGQSQNDSTTNRTIDAHDRIVRVNLDTMLVDVVSVPKVAIGMSVGSSWLQLSALELPAVMDGNVVSGFPPARALLVGGRWLREAAVRPGQWAANFPMTAQFDYSTSDPIIEAVDGDGNVVWARRDLRGVGGDAVSMFSSNGTTLADICATGSDTTGCTAYALVALDTATGVERWRASGLHQFAFVANGMAMVEPSPDTGPGPWELLDMRTGQRVAADQQWADPKAFGNDGGCCFLIRDTAPEGGLVFAADVGVLDVWAPCDLTTQPRSVSLT